MLIDEVVIMAHGSGLQDATAYRQWVAYQVSSYSEALHQLEEPIDVIVALPTYDSEPGHDPIVESLQESIQGTRFGVELAGDSGKMVKGVGLYGYESTDSREWSVFESLWLAGDEPSE